MGGSLNILIESDAKQLLFFPTRSSTDNIDYVQVITCALAVGKRSAFVICVQLQIFIEATAASSKLHRLLDLIDFLLLLTGCSLQREMYIVAYTL